MPNTRHFLKKDIKRSGGNMEKKQDIEKMPQK